MNFGFWGIIWTIVIGLVLGVIGRLILPGKQNIPIWLTILAGVVASIVGYLIANALGVATTNGVDWIELIIKIVLAVAAVAGATALYGNRARA
ncbi:transglycosylase [Pseudonocardia ailaonensis]|uniref:Transglycosylase n=1 Tax=Pseudonocardia ailaonensis TaxID=367279 RepID=A0ABN2NJT0_9PSEU